MSKKKKKNQILSDTPLMKIRRCKVVTARQRESHLLKAMLSSCVTTSTRTTGQRERNGCLPIRPRRHRTQCLAKGKRGKGSSADAASLAAGAGLRGGKRGALDKVLKEIEGAYGAGAIMTLNSDGENTSAVKTQSTGALNLDLALGGGLPKGRVVELYGPESSGKTTLALTCMAACQKAGQQVGRRGCLSVCLSVSPLVHVCVSHTHKLSLSLSVSVSVSSGGLHRCRARL